MQVMRIDDMDQKKKTYDAKDLIMTYVSLCSLEPKKEWGELNLVSNPPRYIRFLRIKALCEAFGIGSIDNLMNGDFIEKEKYRDINPDYLFECIPAGEYEKSKPYYFHMNNLRSGYYHLMAYRERAEKMLSHNNCWLACSGYLSYSLREVDRINMVLKKEIEVMDRTLSKIIDPLQRCFSYEELTFCYNFPEEDLKQIDLDWV